MIEMERIKYLAFSFMCLQWTLVAPAPLDEVDCELHAPNTMHDFCCDMHDEYTEFRSCETEWNDKIHTTNAKAEMSYNFCVSECVYNETEYLAKDRKSLRMNVIKSHLSEMHDDDETEAIMYKTFEACAKHALTMLEHDEVKKLEKRLAKYNCHPFPGLVFECVANELILNCPPKQYHNTAQCDVAREYLQACMKPLPK